MNGPHPVAEINEACAKEGIGEKTVQRARKLIGAVQDYVNGGTVADSSQANKLITDIDAQYLLADRGYDTNEVVSQGMEIVILPKKKRKKKRKYSQEIYENRYQIENTFLKLKRWRGIATRYAKTTSLYVAAVQICCMFLWLQLL